MRYAITGASGQFGRLAADRLLELVDPSEVVLVTRTPSSLDDFAARGAEVRAGDFTDPATLATAFAGVDRLLLVSTDVIGAQRVEGHRTAIRAAVEAGVRHVLYTSVPEPVDANPAQVVPDHAGTEAALRESGVAWTFLRNNLYADMQPASIAQAAASGQFVTNTGAGVAAYVTREDCAHAAVGALIGEGHENQAYDITGPDAVSAADLAAFAAASSGQDVTVVDVDDDAFTAGLVAAGLPAEVAGLIASFGASIRQGYLATVTDAVQQLSGHAPRPLAEVVTQA